MEKNDNYYMNLALNEAKKAYEKDEIPIGVVITLNNKIISKAHNLRDSSSIVTKHAEIIAIEKANRKMKNWRLLNTVLYCTLEPCNMCKEVIKEAKVGKVIYGAKNEKTNTEKNFIQINSRELIEKCENLIKNKFKEIRNKE